MPFLSHVVAALVTIAAFAPGLAVVTPAGRARSSARPGALQSELSTPAKGSVLQSLGKGHRTRSSLKTQTHPFQLDPLVNKSIWNDHWVNFTFWHPSGTVSNVYDGQVTWANVGFMDLGHLFLLSFLAYPGASVIPMALLAAIGVGLTLREKDEPTQNDLRNKARGPPVACPSELTAISKDIYCYWCILCSLLPSIMVFGVPLLLVYASLSWPQEVFTITLIVSSAFVFTNGLYMVFFVPFVLVEMRRNMKKTASEVLSDITDDAQHDVIHWVIFPNYDEDVDILSTAIQSVAQSSLAKTQIGVILAMEEREGERGQEKANKMMQEFNGKFRELAVTMHPANLPNDPPGKASNVAHAFKWLATHVTENDDQSRVHDPCKVILTVADADSEFHRVFFELLTKTYLEHAPEKRNDFLWQSPVLHVKNYHRQPGPVLVGTMFTAMAEIACLADPNAVRCPYSTYSLTMALANEVGGWDAEWIAEDWHMGIKCFLMTLGRTSVQPVLLPTINYTPEANTWVDTLRARFAQAKRHALGFSDITYYFMMLPLVFVRLSSGGKGGANLADFWALLFKGMPYVIKLVNVHVIIGLMTTYAVLDVCLKKTMMFLLDHSISGLFDRTFFATTLFGASTLALTLIVTIAFQALYRIIQGLLEKPASTRSAWMFDNIVAHTLMTVASFAIAGPFYFTLLGYVTWMAAIRLVFSRTFVYEVASKPSKEQRLT